MKQYYIQQHYHDGFYADLPDNLTSDEFFKLVIKQLPCHQKDCACQGYQFSICDDDRCYYYDEQISKLLPISGPLGGNYNTYLI